MNDYMSVGFFFRGSETITAQGKEYVKSQNSD